jgi:hypothetical protein
MLKRRMSSTIIALVWLAILGAGLLSCTSPTPASQTIEPSTNTPLPTGTPAPTDTATVGATATCVFTADSEVTIYNRPSTEAQVFATMPAGFETSIQAQTADGWIGFDPAVAQAANIGPFRMRWLTPDSGALQGGCDELPVLWAPAPGICFDMPMEDVQVLEQPETGAIVVVVLHVGEFAAVTGTTESGWAKVDLAPGNTDSSTTGWVPAGSLNMNGPCDSLPTVTK